MQTLSDRNRLGIARRVRAGFLCGVVWSLLTISSGYAGEITTRPAAAPGPLDNPLKGWCPYTDAGPIHQPYSMVFLYVPWKELEPKEGEYRFAEWEQKTWTVPEARGKHIIFRVYIDYPSLPSGLPEWLRKAGVKESDYTPHGGGRSPDYNDPKMIAAMERLIEAMGKRYNNHPRIAFLQLGLLGFWGEWHTWPREELYANTQTERRIIEAYRKAFPSKKLMVRYAREVAGEQPWIGFHDDMFPQDTDNGKDWSFLAGLRKSNRTENWTRSVVGGEMVPMAAKRYLGDEFQTSLTMAKRAHFTWVGPYCPALEKTKTETFRKRSEMLVRTLGYEFRIDAVTHPDRLLRGSAALFKLQGGNQGVAPFYYPWSVEWALLDANDKPVQILTTKWDIRRWQPGTFTETARSKVTATPGTYRLAIGIRDPWTDRPAIRFANDLPVVDGWTVVSTITVE